MFKFLIKLNSILELRLVNVLAGNFNLSCNEILFTFNNKSLIISEYVGEKLDIYFEKSEWVKLIFGVVPVESEMEETTLHHLGVSSGYRMFEMVNKDGSRRLIKVLPLPILKKLPQIG